jgi:hypothetical protein
MFLILGKLLSMSNRDMLLISDVNKIESLSKFSKLMLKSLMKKIISATQKNNPKIRSFEFL